MNPLLEQFKREVCNNAEVDEGETQDWFSLSYGYFIALTHDINLSWDLAMEARYKYGYWTK